MRGSPETIDAGTQTFESAPTDNSRETSLDDLSLEQLQGELATARSTWAALSSKRQRRAVNREIEGYRTAKHHYHDLLVHVERRQLAEQLDSTDDEDARRRLTLQYWLDEQNILRNEAKQTAEGKLRWRFGEKFAKFMNSGGRGQRFMKSVGVGATIGLLAGVGGAGAVGVGVAVAAARYGKGYLMRHSEAIDQVDMTVDQLEQNYSEISNDELSRYVREDFNAIYDNDTRQEQRKIRSAVRGGLGAVALGGAIGATIGVAADVMITDAKAEGSGSSGGSVTSHDSPGVAVNAAHESVQMAQVVDDHESPGLSGEAHESPDVATRSSHESPGIATDGGSHKSPGLANDVRENPSMTNPDEHKSPGLAANSHESPGIAESEGETHQSPGIDGVTDSEKSAPSGNNSTKIDSFTVNHGHGYTHELIEAASANGVDMSIEEAKLAHEAIVDQVGSDYIDLINHQGADTYSLGDRAYDTGITAPGEAVWSSEAQPLIADAIDDGEINGSSIDTDGQDDTQSTDSKQMTEKNEPTPHNQTDSDSEANNSANQSDSRDVNKGTDSQDLNKTDAPPSPDGTGNTGITDNEWRQIDKALDTALINDQLEVVSSAMQQEMNALGPKLSDVYYSDGLAVVSQDPSGNWSFNEAPEGKGALPPEADKIIRNYLENHENVKDKILNVL